MTDPRLDRRRLLQATAAGIGSLAVPSTAVSGATTAQAETPDEGEYQEIIDGMDGEGTEADPHVVTDIVELQAIAGDLAAHYELGTDVDASATAGWNDGAGFDPLGSEAEPLTGSLRADGHEVSGLTIDRPTEQTVGLVSWNRGWVSGLTVTDATITGGDSTGTVLGTNHGVVRDVRGSGEVTGGEEFAGGLAGSNSGRLNRTGAAATVTGDERIGGLCGINIGVVLDSSAESDVTATAHAGGLCAVNVEQIEGSSAAGTVSADASVGGLVAQNDGTIQSSRAEASVDAGETVGGLVGESWGEVRESAARGDVTGEQSVGGFAGKNWGVLQAIAAGSAVEGDSFVGGVVGWNGPGGEVSNTYAAGEVTGESDAGALVGRLGWEFQAADESATLNDSYWDSDVIPLSAVGSDEPGDGETTVEAAISLMTDQMRGENAEVHMPLFDFEETWRSVDGEYPRVRALTTPVFEVVDFSPESIELRQDEAFTVSVTLRNAGEWNGNGEVTLLVDGEGVANETVSLEPGGQQTMEITLQASTFSVGPHSYAVRTPDDEVSGSFVVNDPGGDSENPDDSDNGTTGDDTPADGSTDADADDDGPGFSIPGAIAGLGGTAYLLARRLSASETSRDRD